MDLLKNLFKGDKVVWIIFLFLCLISMIEVFSATSTLSFKSGNHWTAITNHTTFLIFGAFVVLIVHNLNYRFFQLAPFILLPLSFFMMLFISIMGHITGDKVNGAARWFEIAGVQFQPSELAKMGIIIFVAFILARNQQEKREGAKEKKNGSSAFKIISIVTGFFVVLIGMENISTALLLMLVVLMMMFIGRIETRKMLLTLGTLALGVLLAVSAIMLAPDAPEPAAEETTETVTSADIPQEKERSTFGLGRFSTAKQRILRFLNNKEVPPEEYDMDKNAQEAHAHIAIASSNIIGKLPGNSVERDFLSQAFSDFIFAIIIEELGLIGGIFVISLYIVLLVRAGRIAQKARGDFASFLVLGIALLIVTQALVNMSVAVGLIPVTGQPLPLISKGGTAILINAAYFGMILSVSRYTANLEKKQGDLPDTELSKEQIIKDQERLEEAERNQTERPNEEA